MSFEINGTSHRLLYDQSLICQQSQKTKTNKQLELFYYSVNPTFLVREIFLKTSRILYLKITRVGMKVSNYHSVLFMLLCKFRPILPRSQKVFSTTFIGYFCASLLQLCFCYYGFDFLSRFLLETKESESIKLHGNRKGSYRIYRV